MPLDDLERPKRHSYRNKSIFGAQQKNLNKDRHRLGAEKCRIMILFSRNTLYKVCADIRMGSLDSRRRMTVWFSKS